MFTVYESELNTVEYARQGMVKEHVCHFEDVTHFWEILPTGEEVGHGKGYCFRNRQDAERVNELLQTKGFKAARKHAESINRKQEGA